MHDVKASEAFTGGFENGMPPYKYLETSLH
jgi:hypothetical protein